MRRGHPEDLNPEEDPNATTSDSGDDWWASAPGEWQTMIKPKKRRGQRACATRAQQLDFWRRENLAIPAVYASMLSATARCLALPLPRSVLSPMPVHSAL